MIDATELGWIQKLVGFMDKFYRCGPEEDMQASLPFTLFSLLPLLPFLSFPPSPIVPPPSFPPLPRREVRTAVRIEALNFLARVLAENSLSHEAS